MDFWFSSFITFCAALEYGTDGSEAPPGHQLVRSVTVACTLDGSTLNRGILQYYTYRIASEQATLLFACKQVSIMPTTTDVDVGTASGTMTASTTTSVTVTAR
jgi:hypothetical protein